MTAGLYEITEERLIRFVSALIGLLDCKRSEIQAQTDRLREHKVEDEQGARSLLLNDSYADPWEFPLIYDPLEAVVERAAIEADCLPLVGLARSVTLAERERYELASHVRDKCEEVLARAHEERRAARARRRREKQAARAVLSPG